MRIRSSDFLTLADDSMAKAMDEASDQDLVMALHAMSQVCLSRGTAHAEPGMFQLWHCAL